ncbi:MAG: hypothetical protein AAF742_09270 [Pseudomonadota bacterium]
MVLAAKREDLTVEKQKKILERLVGELSRDHIDFYYKSTIDVAYLLRDYIRGKAQLSVDERALVEPLSQRDIQLRLSLH